MRKSRNPILHPAAATAAADTTQSEPFGLIAWLDQTRVRLPLKGVEARFDICGDLVSVELDQIWHQDNPRPVHCLYTFPLPAGAAVHRCELHVNDRLLVAKVEEVAEARRLAAEMKKAGHRTALVEQVRDNVFELALGNLAPGDVVIVRFAYVQSLERDGNTASFRFPMCPGVRYIPGRPLLRDNQGRGAADDTDQVPDASRISPPRIDALHPDAAYVSVEGRLADPADAVDHIVSPSHPLLVRDAEGWKHLELAHRDAVPDRDFVVRWQEAAPSALASAGWGDGQGHCLVRLVAPEDAAVTRQPQDVYFLLDRSGSMNGRKWEKACAALHAFRDNLGADDRVWLTLFESAHQDFAERPLPAAELGANRAWRELASHGTAGGTNLLPALQHVLHAVARHSADRPSTVVLITDGEVGNELEIEQAMAAQPALRLHVFGIDTTLNDGFLRRLARQHRGSCALAHPSDDIPAMVSRLAVRLRRPVVTGLTLPGGWETTAAGLPDLHAGETLSIALAGPAQDQGFSLHGRDANGEPWTTRIELAADHVPAVRLLWARERLNHLLACGRRDQAVALAKLHNLLCEGTAFIAWDPQEKVVADGVLDLYQPALEAMMPCCVMAMAPARLREDIILDLPLRDSDMRDSLGPRPLAMSAPPKQRTGLFGEVRARLHERRLQKQLRTLESQLQECRTYLAAAGGRIKSCEERMDSVRRRMAEGIPLPGLCSLIEAATGLVTQLHREVARLEAQAGRAASDTRDAAALEPAVLELKKWCGQIESQWLPWIEGLTHLLERWRPEIDPSTRAELLTLVAAQLERGPAVIAAQCAKALARTVFVPPHPLKITSHGNQVVPGP